MVDIRFGGWQNHRHAEVTGGGQPSRNDNVYYAMKHEPNDQEVKKFQRRQVGDLDAAGDTIMGGINAANITNTERRRAIWKTKTQIEKLRQEGRCFRCERQGCVTSRCPLLPAKKPKNLQIKSLSLPEIDPSVYTVDEENTGSEN